MSKPESKPPDSVYDAYDAVEKCAKDYYAASKIVSPYHETAPNVGGYTERMAKADDEFNLLAKHLRSMKRRRSKAARLIATMSRDIHRACANRPLIVWGETTAASAAEGVLAVAAKGPFFLAIPKANLTPCVPPPAWV